MLWWFSHFAMPARIGPALNWLSFALRAVTARLFRVFSCEPDVT
jgi:hypothetical protein